MGNMSQEIAVLFLDHSTSKMKRMATHVSVCLGMLTQEQVWQRSNENVNSVGNLVLHLCGNIRQWIGFGIAGQEDIRRRDAEFAAKDGPKEDLAALFEKTVAEALETLEKLPGERLVERIVPQGNEVSVLDAIYQVTGHLQEHTGQIVFVTKQMTGRDLALVKPRR
jgi:uncharacterized damage-inducible protein DinB